MIFEDQKERELPQKHTQLYKKNKNKNKNKNKKAHLNNKKRQNYNYQSHKKVGNLWPKLEAETEDKASKQQPTNGGS